MKTTSHERYQAYWNKNDRKFVSVKREEDCSGLLAYDLQVRIAPHGLIATVEHHMVNDKECDLAVLMGPSHFLPIEMKHHYNPDLWTAWRTQLDKLYTRDPKTGGFGVYCVLWSARLTGGTCRNRQTASSGRTSAVELHSAIAALIPPADQAMSPFSAQQSSPPERDDFDPTRKWSYR